MPIPTCAALYACGRRNDAKRDNATPESTGCRLTRFHLACVRPCQEGATALDGAMFLPSTDMARLLLDKQASVNVKRDVCPRTDRSAVGFACRFPT